MPYALCPMPREAYALCPVVPHLSEKGYNIFNRWGFLTILTPSFFTINRSKPRQLGVLTVLSPRQDKEEKCQSWVRIEIRETIEELTTLMKKEKDVLRHEKLQVLYWLKTKTVDSVLSAAVRRTGNIVLQYKDGCLVIEKGE